MELLTTRGQATSPSNRLVQVMRRHPLLCYFLLAFGLTWAFELPVLLLLHPSDPYHGMAPILLLGPALSALLMTAILEGKPGVWRLLRRYVLWRAGLRWYLLVLLGIPALILLSALTVPGAIATFRAPTPLFLLTGVLIYLFILTLDGPLGEEVGWSGFALPRLQQRSGPLAGTLIIGSLWGLWHLPLYLFIPGFNGAGTGLLGIGLPFVEFVIFAIALRFLITWVFNNVRGSLLLVLLLHTSYNAGFYLLPSLVRLVNVNVYLVFVVVAMLIIAATRGRLSYERYLRETALPAPVTDREGEKGEARASV
jgi:membrane protease YdiL (CAAX protease family)